MELIRNTRLACIAGLLALGLGFAACSDEDGDGATTDEEVEEIDDDAEDIGDEVEDEADELEDEVEDE